MPELASWNEESLRQELAFLSDLDIDFDFTAIGFDTAEVDVILGGTEADDQADALPAMVGVPAVSRPGDLWLLNNHRLYCGSALEQSSYDHVLAGHRAAMVFTDPPYNVRIDGHVGGKGAIKHREFAMASGEMTADEFTAFLSACLAHVAALAQDGAICFFCMDWRHIGELLTAAKAFTLKNVCVWVKNNGGMGSLYRSQHEFVFVFKCGAANHVNNVELGKHGRNRTNVWEYRGSNSFGSGRDELLKSHPTVKPVALVADAIKDCSHRGDLILDPFAGSGTTLIAAEKTMRRSALIEIDPLYVDGIVRRWQAFTGQPGRLRGVGHDVRSTGGSPRISMHRRGMCVVSDESNHGYKRPPKTGQFRPGQSGNPRGRPKGTRNLKTDLDKMLRKRIRIRENGETREISRQEAILLSLFNKAMQGGDVRAANTIVGWS